MGTFFPKMSSENTQIEISTPESDNEDQCFHDAETELDTNGSMNNEIKKMITKQYLENVQTDAIESRRPKITTNTNITYETIRDIEGDLTFYEKVSLVFLMFEQEDIALQSLLIEKENIIIQQTTNLLYNWAQSKHKTENSWKKIIIEGLCIIQNYSLLERLGYNKDELIAIYLPTNCYTAMNINIMRKSLYCFCESMTVEKIKLFLTYLEADFMLKGFKYIRFNEIYLEMYILQCYSVKYIKNNDISNIVSILKKMNMHKQIEMLESFSIHAAAARSNGTSAQTNEIVKKNVYVEEFSNVIDVRNFKLNSNLNNNKLHNPTTGSCSDHSVIGINSLVKTYPSGEYYTIIDPENVGICLIINQNKFYVDEYNEDDPNLILTPSEPLGNRCGTEFDRDKLKDTFSKFNFRIDIKDDLTDVEMKQNIKRAMQKFSQKDSCFVVCILSHGQQDSVFGVNSIPVSISELEDLLHDTSYSALLGKPKVLIIQSCQGKPLQQVVPINQQYVTDGVGEETTPTITNIVQFIGKSVPQKKDLLVVMSTVSGYASVRAPKYGTWFIQELCKVLETDSDNDHFEDIITKVIRQVSDKRWHKGDKVVTMVPQKISTFSKKLSFALAKIQPC